jgi:hypothetical protein
MRSNRIAKAETKVRRQKFVLIMIAVALSMALGGCGGQTAGTYDGSSDGMAERNFEDMKDLIKKLYSDEDLKDTSFSEYLAIGNFDISVEEESIAGKPYDERYNYSYEYYSKLF